MKKLLAAAMLLVPAMLFAQSPFDGTWKTDLNKAKFSNKPGRRATTERRST
jgi:hypothetical protein